MKIELPNQYKRNAHNAGGSFWHLQWCTKYRYKMFGREYYRNLCKTLLLEAAKRHKIVILTMNVQLDHLHLFAEFPPTYSVSKVVQLFRGISAYKILHRHPNLRYSYLRNGHFWSAGKFYRSVGNVTADTIQHYIKQSQHGWNFEHQTKLL